MEVYGLDHFTINTPDLDKTAVYYERYMKMRPGWRPELSIPGIWLYAENGDYPILHVVENSTMLPPDSRRAVDHVAFRCRGLSEHIARMEEDGQILDARPVPETDLVQVHQLDPSGIKLELTFEGEELPDHVKVADLVQN